MNNWNCPKCNFANTVADSFCRNCGAPIANVAQSALDLPPTVIGMPPPPLPPQQQNFSPHQSPQPPPNFQQTPPPPNFQPQQPNFQPQQPFQTTPPQSSSVKKIALLVGVIGLVVVIAGGIPLWFMVIGPHFEEQARLKKESDNQMRANSTTAISLLPESYTGLTRTFRKGKTLDKMQLLQASQNLPPELKSELNNINDAAAAEYVSATDSSQKVLLQIFKYNTPAQAVANCDKVGLELQKNQASFKEVIYRTANEYLPTNCYTYAEDKNKGFTGISTLYGFLLIYTGHKDNEPAAVKTVVFNELTR